MIVWHTWISPGTFNMGSPDSEVDRALSEGPQTTVTITRGYWLGNHEVTQAEYLDVTGSNPSGFAGDLSRPVETVSWLDANDYCARLTAREQNAGRIPANYFYRLPSEAEWEYACRAGTTTRFSYGDDPGYTQLTQYGWYNANNAPPGPKPVGLQLPNPWGLYDMHGNVNEWCSDFFANSHPGGAVTDPLGPTSGTSRVIRGSSWASPDYVCRSASRYGEDPTRSDSTVGFRVVLSSVDPGTSLAGRTHR